MHTRNLVRLFGRRAARAGLALTAALLLSTGAVWSVVASGDAPVDGPPAVAPAVVQAPLLPEGARESYADIVEAVAPAVVTIRTEATSRVSTTALPNDDFFRRFFGDRFGEGPEMPRTFRRSGLGSGVVMGDGYILTNHHVIADADEIVVDLADGRSMSAELVGSDEPSDLALLKVDEVNLRAADLGDSDAVRVGDVVLAVGNPLGVGQTVTMGIISAKGRSTRSGAGSPTYEDFLQTDAPINHGNSGGALVNLRGEVIGINSQILSPSSGNIGIGFAIPSNMARDVVDQLRTKGRVTRAQLGVIVQPVTSDMARSLGLSEVTGAIVAEVTPGSAADRAGIERGDIIRSFDGQPVHDTNSLRNRVAMAGPGTKTELTILRDGNERRMSVELGEATPSRAAGRDGDSGGAAGQATLGLALSPLTPERASRLSLPRDTRGLLVEDVDPAGRAADAGIRAGDIIEEVDRWQVETVDQLRAAVNATTDRPLLLLVTREGTSLFVTVPQAG